MHGKTSHSKPYLPADPQRRAFIVSVVAMAPVAALNVSPAFAAAPATQRMSALIADLKRLTTELEAADQPSDPFGWEKIANQRCRALEALLDQKPSSVAEFADKFEALIPLTEEDSELVALHVLADDIRSLT